MYRLINANAPAVVHALRRIGDLREYLDLRAAIAVSGSEAGSPDFQRAYRKYWRMNAARLPQSFYDRYFRLLSEYRERGVASLEDTVRVISDPTGDNHGLQFSFATKLIHMVDPRVPVFDSFVAAFYFFVPPASDRPFDERLAALLEFHRFLAREYARILANGLLTPSIQALRQDGALGSSVPDERIIDWLLWAWVSLLQKQAQIRGEALYD